jgi:stage III sporulation protein SpoIIIAA
MSSAGKTTLLRDITRMLADTFQKVVIVVDPSQEIAGGGQVPHSCIGSARRMTGTTKQSKHEVLQEAVTNHGPEVFALEGTAALRTCGHIVRLHAHGMIYVFRTCLWMCLCG